MASSSQPRDVMAEVAVAAMRLDATITRLIHAYIDDTGTLEDFMDSHTGLKSVFRKKAYNMIFKYQASPRGI